MYTELTEGPTVLEQDDYATITADIVENENVATNEFEFTADLAVELPTHIDPNRFFDYLVRVMIAHTEAYGGFMGGGTKWNQYEVDENE